MQGAPERPPDPPLLPLMLLMLEESVTFLEQGCNPAAQSSEHRSDKDFQDFSIAASAISDAQKSLGVIAATGRPRRERERERRLARVAMYDLYALGPPLYKIKAASLVAGIWESVTEKPVVLGLVSSPTQTSFPPLTYQSHLSFAPKTTTTT